MQSSTVLLQMSGSESIGNIVTSDCVLSITDIRAYERRFHQDLILKAEQAHV
jgi:hypothetical protein